MHELTAYVFFVTFVFIAQLAVQPLLNQLDLFGAYPSLGQTLVTVMVEAAHGRRLFRKDVIDRFLFNDRCFGGGKLGRRHFLVHSRGRTGEAGYGGTGRVGDDCDGRRLGRESTRGARLFVTKTNSITQTLQT